MHVADPAPTLDLLTDVLELTPDGDAGDGATVFSMGEGGPAARLDVVETATARGRGGAGTVHHIALRVPEMLTQLYFGERVARYADLEVTRTYDRQYFRSIYFREEGGILLELATDEPGFGVDEPVASLGSALKLPPWLESRRDAISQALPPIRDDFAPSK